MLSGLTFSNLTFFVTVAGRPAGNKDIRFKAPGLFHRTIASRIKVLFDKFGCRVIECSNPRQSTVSVGKELVIIDKGKKMTKPVN